MTHSRATLAVSFGRARSFASIGLLVLVFGVALIQAKVPIGGVQLDAVIVLIPVALALMWPLLRHYGAPALPAQWGATAAFVFFVALLVSAAVTMSGVGGVLTVVRYAAYVALMLAVALFARDPASRRFLLWAIALAGVVTTGWAVQQYLRDMQSAAARSFVYGRQLRIEGTFGNANFYAEFLVLAIAVSVALMLTERRWAGRVLAGASAAVTTGVLLITYTRGSWIALAAAAVVAVSIVSVRYVAALIPLGVVGLALVPEGLDRLLSVFSTQGSTGFRLKLWRIAGEAIAANPWFGVGPGEFLTVFRQMVIDNPELNMGYMEYGAHNSFFTLAAEGGAICGIAFALFTLAVATRGLFLASREGVARRDQAEILALTTGVLAFWLNTFSSNVFQHPQGATFFWIVSGVMLACGADLWRRPVRQSASVRPVRSGLVASAGVLRLFAALGTAVDRAWRASLAFTLTSGAAVRGSSLPRSRLVRWMLGDGAPASSES